MKPRYASLESTNERFLSFFFFVFRILGQSLYTVFIVATYIYLSIYIERYRYTVMASPFLQQEQC